MGDEFRPFDVLVKIGHPMKFMVEKVDSIDYKLVELGAPQTAPGYRIGGYVVKCSCESQYVKVGRWDLNGKREVEDE